MAQSFNPEQLGTESSIRSDSISPPPAITFSTQVVEVSQLLNQSFVNKTEECFLNALASYVSGRVFDPGAALLEPLADQEREKVARKLGEFFVQHCKNDIKTNMKGIEQYDERTIRGLARYCVDTYGNTYDNGVPKPSSFASEVARAKEYPERCFWIVSSCEGASDSISQCAGMFAGEHFVRDNDSIGFHFRQLMIDPTFRDGIILQKLFSKLSTIETFKSASFATLATIPFVDPLAGDKVKTPQHRLYSRKGLFKRTENPKTIDGVLAENPVMQSQQLNAEVFCAMQTDDTGSLFELIDKYTKYLTK